MVFVALIRLCRICSSSVSLVDLLCAMFIGNVLIVLAESVCIRLIISSVAERKEARNVDIIYTNTGHPLDISHHTIISKSEQNLGKW